MKCRKPFVQGVLAFPCGQCIPCRVNRRRVWTHRLMLERMRTPEACFITLTYDEENLPENGSLMPVHMQLWLKRFRKMIAPRSVRYYLVGEYGDESWRPHYHVALYGYGPCQYGRSQYSKRRLNCCPVCDLVRDTWGLGFIYIGELETKSAAYIAGYIMKKMTKVDDVRLQGRFPEFARMSLRPGIGALSLQPVIESLQRYRTVESEGDVPAGLRHGSSVMPLGRYLREKLREVCGGSNEAALREWNDEMLVMLASSLDDEEAPSIKAQIVKSGAGEFARTVAMRKLYKERKGL